MKRLLITPKPFRSTSVIVVLNVLLGLAGAAAVAALVLEYGFRRPPVSLEILHAVEAAIVAIFIIDRLGRWVLARRRRAYLRANWIDFALIAAAGLAMAVYLHLRGKVLAAGALYVLITQAYLLVSLLLRAVSVNLRFAGSGIHPSILLIASFLFLSLAGSGLLMLPVATPPTTPGPYYIDALFTATSATCVTGLIVRDTGGDWSPFGQGVILVLIQVGGLGIMVSGTMLAMLLGKSLSMRGSDTVGQMLATDRVGDLARIIKFVIVTAFVLEAVGAVLFYRMFAAAGRAEMVSTGKAIWEGVFHSVSSFCNAGFSLMGSNMMEGVREGWGVPLRQRWQIMGVMAPLVVLGGLGFPVLQDCGRWARRAAARLWERLKGNRATGRPARFRLTLHSKIVLTASVALIVVGAAGILLLELNQDRDRQVVGYHPTIDGGSGQKSDWASLSTVQRAKAAVFQSITARTAGFNTIDIAELSTASKAWICGLMTIGGSPASTAGGMKTITVALLILTVYCTIRKRRDLEVFGRTVPVELVRKTFTLAVLYLGLVAVVALLLSVAMRGWDFIDLLFEASSACGTVGLSTGITRQLNMFAKCVIIAGMFIGRIGPVTLLIAMTTRVKYVAYEYPTETVVVG